MPVSLRVWLRLASMMLGIAGSLPAHGMITLSATRLVFDGARPEVVVQAWNQGAKPVLLQAWLSAVQGPEVPVPFALTPPLTHLQPNGRQALRLFYLGDGLPTQRETLLYLFVLAVPPATPGSNALQIAVRQRINVFYRPPGLVGIASASPEELRWWLSVDRQRVVVLNPSAYHVALIELMLGGQKLSESLLIAPGAQHELDIPLGVPANASHISFVALSDFGGQYPYTAVLHTSPL